MDLLTQIIVAVLTSSAVAGAVVVAGGFLVKSIIDRWITMSLKRYETSLQMSLESYKTSLQQSASEHQTRFTKLHEKRAEVIDELYKRMARVQRNFDELIKPFVLPGEKTPDEKQKALVENGNQFLEYMTENRLYLGDDLYARLEKLWQEMRKTFYGFTIPGSMNATAEENLARWDKTWQKVTVEFREIEKEIENDLRQMLGDTSVPKGSA